MLLSFDDATPLRKGGSGPATGGNNAGSDFSVALIPSSGGSYSTSELCSTLVVETPASAERGFLATSLDGICESARKHLFVVSPDHPHALETSPDQSSQGASLLDDDDDGGDPLPSFLDDANEVDLSTSGAHHKSTKDIATLLLEAEHKLSVIRSSLERALRTAESVRTLASADGDLDGAATSEEECNAVEPPIPRPQRSIPVPHSIDEERNLRLVADLVLTPGKTLTLSP